MSQSTFIVEEDKKSLTVTRVFNAPKDKVWEAYTTAELIEKWWGPIGWETTVKKLDFEEGGEWIYAMKCNDERQVDWYGKESWGKTVYKDIDPKNSFAYTDYFCDTEGNIMPDMPVSHSVIEFEELEDGKTKLVMHTSYENPEELKKVLEMGMQEGFEMTLDRLEEFVTND